jgi:hypothetical protein
MGPGNTAKLMSVRVKRRIRLILGAAYPRQIAKSEAQRDEVPSTAGVD